MLLSRQNPSYGAFLPNCSYSPQIVAYAIAAVAMLWIRSTSELVVATRYHLKGHASSAGTWAARDFVYGFCSSIFLVLMAPVARDTAEANVQNKDTQAVEADCRQYIIN